MPRTAVIGVCVFALTSCDNNSTAITPSPEPLRESTQVASASVNSQSESFTSSLSVNTTNANESTSENFKSSTTVTTTF